ncbi:leucine carboxyl methyltransferase 1 [Trichomonascus vanleenenianus]|uniref:leucine carboxy methyltransferase n=1 Tax=Trichomonascus vanleenenianus TaxID=2268995 RepID=UPI003ECACE25
MDLIQARRDKIIRDTDLDALSSKYSAQATGYLNDPFLDRIVDGFRSERGFHRIFTQKFPLMNRGSYLRIHSIDELIKAFLTHGGCQVVSLGAGSDTRPFALLPKYPSLIYHEVDFKETTIKKCGIIKKNAELSEIIGLDPSHSVLSPEIHTERYHLHAKDLRNLSDESTFEGLDKTLETLIVSECCLCYLEPAKSNYVLDWFTSRLRKASLVLYEPIGGNDKFGAVMVENLSKRGISLPSLNLYPDLDSQMTRLREHGFSYVFAKDMHRIHNEWLTEEESERIDQLEFLDEREELYLLLQHYCIACATNYQTTYWQPFFE